MCVFWPLNVFFCLSGTSTSLLQFHVWKFATRQHPLPDLHRVRNTPVQSSDLLANSWSRTSAPLGQIKPSVGGCVCVIAEKALLVGEMWLVPSTLGCFRAKLKVAEDLHACSGLHSGEGGLKYPCPHATLAWFFFLNVQKYLSNGFPCFAVVFHRGALAYSVWFSMKSSRCAYKTALLLFECRAGGARTVHLWLRKGLGLVFSKFLRPSL